MVTQADEIGHKWPAGPHQVAAPPQGPRAGGRLQCAPFGSHFAAANDTFRVGGIQLDDLNKTTARAFVRGRSSLRGGGGGRGAILVRVLKPALEAPVAYQRNESACA